MKEVQPTRAAILLNVHVNTIYTWCKEAIAGTPTMLRSVRRTITGRYWIPREEIDRLLSEDALPDFA